MKSSFILLIIVTLLCNCFAQSAGFLSIEDFENPLQPDFEEDDFLPEESLENWLPSEENIYENEDAEYLYLDQIEIQGNSYFENLLFASIKILIEEGIKEGYLLANGSYHIGQIFGVEVKIGHQENYRISLQLSDDQNRTSDTTFYVFYDPKLDITKVLSYEMTFLSEAPEQPEGINLSNMTPIDLDEVGNNMTLLTIGTNGINFVINEGVKNNYLVYSDFEPSVVYAVSYREVEGGVIYLWDLDIADTVGNSAGLMFVIFYSPETFEMQVLAYNIFNVIIAPPQ